MSDKKIEKTCIAPAYGLNACLYRRMGDGQWHCAFEDLCEYQLPKIMPSVRAVSQSPVSDLKEIPEGTTYTNDTERCDECVHDGVDCPELTKDKCDFQPKPPHYDAPSDGSIDGSKKVVKLIPTQEQLTGRADGKCPKCGKTIGATTLCWYCGTIFAPYTQEQGGDDAGFLRVCLNAKMETIAEILKDKDILRARLTKAEEINKSNCDAATRTEAKIARLEHENAELTAMWDALITWDGMPEKVLVKAAEIKRKSEVKP